MRLRTKFKINSLRFDACGYNEETGLLPPIRSIMRLGRASDIIHLKLATINLLINFYQITMLTIDQAKKILGVSYKNYTPEQIQEMLKLSDNLSGTILHELIKEKNHHNIAFSGFYMNKIKFILFYRKFVNLWAKLKETRALKGAKKML